MAAIAGRDAELAALEAADSFVSRHIAPSEDDIAAMLREVGWGFAWRRLYQWSPRPVSEAVLWLLSDQARYVTGTSIAVDSGSLIN